MKRLDFLREVMNNIENVKATIHTWLDMKKENQIRVIVETKFNRYILYDLSDIIFFYSEIDPLVFDDNKKLIEI